MLPIILVRRQPWTDWPDGRQRNARNNAFRVQMAGQMPASVSWLGVLAQEVYESRHKLAWLRWVWMSDEAREQMEIVGHAIEARVAHVFDGMFFEKYLADEAQSLLRPGSSYYRKGLFIGETFDSVLKRLRGADGKAREWVMEHYEELTEWRRRYGR